MEKKLNNIESILDVHNHRINNIEIDVKDLKSDVKQMQTQSYDSAKHSAELTATVKQAANDLCELKRIVDKNHDEISELKVKVNIDKSYQAGIDAALRQGSERIQNKTKFWFSMIGILLTAFGGFITYHEWRDGKVDKAITQIIKDK